MKYIRTKDKIPRTIRQLDRAAGLRMRMRKATFKGVDGIWTKTDEEQEETSQDMGKQSPSNYAIGKITEQAEIVAEESAYQIADKGVWVVRKMIDQFARLKNNPKVTIQGIKAIGKRLIKLVQGAGRKLTAVVNVWKTLAAGSMLPILIVMVCCIFGGAFAYYGSGSSESVLPVSAEVEAYDTVIRTYARQYGIEEYVQLIKAVMMQESGGLGGDPMQASEGPYNTRYPKGPNGITNAEYSIQCGVQELKSCLDAAGCTSPMDMPKIKLALQGYNYGNGYISWALQRDGCYTEENAIVFSDMMAARMGWTSYGDKEYVPHVLRYYPYGQTFGGGSGLVLVETALTQVGNVGGTPYWSWYGFSSRVEWCACFVSWCGNQCGYIDSGAMPKFSYCPNGADWFKARNQWRDRSYLPSPGDIIFFDWQGDGVTDHVGIVQSCDGRTVYTVEGNSRDAVRQRSYNVGSGSIYGYGILLNE